MMYRCYECGRQQDEDYGSWNDDPDLFFCSKNCHEKYDKIMLKDYQSMSKKEAIALLKSIGCDRQPHADVQHKSFWGKVTGWLKAIISRK